MNGLRVLCVTAALVMLASCAAPVMHSPLELPAALSNIQSQTRGGVAVSVAILTDDQARRHFGADLGQQDVQAVWLSVRNASGRQLWFIPNLLDPDVYTADEIALMVRNSASERVFDTLRQRFRDETIRVLLPSATMTEGFVFVPKVEGGRFIDIALQGDAWDEESARNLAEGAQRAPGAARPRELRFGFAVALPDGDFDYERLDPAQTYAGRHLPEHDTAQLRAALEKLPCCTTDAGGRSDGDPINAVLIGDATDVLSALSRSGWSFTHRVNARTIVREIGAALTGTPYPVAPVSNLYALGRAHDVALQRARRSIAQRNHMRLWLAPFRFAGRPVWIGQVSRDIGVKVTAKSPTLTTHVIDPAVDMAREYLLHSLLAHHRVERFGFVRGGAAAPRGQPRVNLTDDPYFSDGMRLVVFVSREPVAPEAVRFLLWERSAAPVAEGQSDAAKRNVRPLPVQ